MRLPTLLAPTLAAVMIGGASTRTGEALPREPQLQQVGNSFAISQVRIFDGITTIDNATLVVREGRIAEVGSTVRIPAGLPVIDGSGKTVLPGFLDAHTHSRSKGQQEALRFGVTGQLDMLGDWQRAPDLRKQREGLAQTDRADLWTAGAAVTAPGGHGTQYGMAVPTLPATGDAAAFAQARIAEGSDFVKIIVEDMSVYGAPTRLPTITAAQVADAIAGARAADRLALVHVAAQRDARHAITSNAHGLVHIFQDEVADDELVAAASRQDTFVIPTLSVIATMAGASIGPELADDPRLAPWIDGDQRTGLTRTFGPLRRPEFLERALVSVRKLHQAGVTILAGTDAPNPGTAQGVSTHGELTLLTRAGLSPTEALAAASSRVAERFGLTDRGRIAPGLRADLLLVEGDPTVDISATRAIVKIWKNGYPVERTVPTTAR